MSVVIGVRIPKKLKEELERLGIDYANEVREFLEKRVREEKARRLLQKIEEFRKGIQIIERNLAAELIREDRESR